MFVVFSSRSKGRSPSKCRVPRSPRRAATCVDRAGKEPTGFRYPREPLLVSPTVAQAHPWVFGPRAKPTAKLAKTSDALAPAVSCVCVSVRAPAPPHTDTHAHEAMPHTRTAAYISHVLDPLRCFPLSDRLSPAVSIRDQSRVPVLGCFFGL